MLHPIIRHVAKNTTKQKKCQLLLGTLKGQKHQLWISPSTENKSNARLQALLTDEDDEKVWKGTVVRLANENMIEMDRFWDGFPYNDWRHEYRRYFAVFEDAKCGSGGTTTTVELKHRNFNRSGNLVETTTTHQIEVFERKLGLVPVTVVRERDMKLGSSKNARYVVEGKEMFEWPRSKYVGRTSEDQLALENMSPNSATSTATLVKRQINREGSDSSKKSKTTYPRTPEFPEDVVRALSDMRSTSSTGSLIQWLDQAQLKNYNDNEWSHIVGEVVDKQKSFDDGQDFPSVERLLQATQQQYNFNETTVVNTPDWKQWEKEKTAPVLSPDPDTVAQPKQLGQPSHTKDTSVLMDEVAEHLPKDKVAV